MEQKEARAYFNYLLTLNVRREEAFGPLALTFIKEHDLDKLGLIAEEQFNLLSGTVQALVQEPKRYNLKLELLKKVQELLPQVSFSNPELRRQIEYDIKKTEAELKIYNDAMKPARTEGIEKQRIIVQTDVPDYFLNIAQKRAATYYQNKFGISKEAKTAALFGGTPMKFEPDNKTIHKQFSGSCPPFMNSRINAFHLMLPFDLKISRKPDDPLDAGVRIFYSKIGYSFPLAYENGKLVNYNDGEVLDLSMDDPNLMYVSVSRVKEKEFQFQGGDSTQDLPPDYVYPATMLERLNGLGAYFQIVCNFKIWFDASLVNVLIQGAPDLYEYGLQSGSGLMTRSHASDKVPAYVESTKEPWQEGLSFNFVNMHVMLSPDKDSATIPYNTPIFTVYPVLNRQNYKFEDSRNVS